MRPEVLSHVHAECVTEPAVFEALEPEWTSVWQRCPDATPFQSPQWTIAWWRVFGDDRSLRAVPFRNDEGELVGLAALYVDPMEDARVLRFIGAGLSDYLDVLALPDAREHVSRALFEYVAEQSEDWDRVEFQQVPAGSALRTHAPAAAACVPGEPCPALRLPAPGDSLPGSARLHANIAADRRRLERHAGPVGIEVATAETAPAIFEALRHLHGARWEQRGEPGVLAPDDAWSFHCDAANGLIARGVARLYALRVREHVAGVYYGFLHQGTAYYYLGGFDPWFRAFGIGNQLVGHAIEDAGRLGATTFDFLRGQEAYKYRWGAQDRLTFCIRCNSGVRSASPQLFQPRAGTDGSVAQSLT